LRLLAISPNARQQKEKDGSGRPGVLYQAMSVFLDHGSLYRVTAGVFRLGDETDAMMAEGVKRRLEAMLAGLTVRPPASTH